MGALHDAIMDWNDDQIYWLLMHGADVNESDENGNTPLMLAARQSLSAIVPELLVRGADIHVQDRAGKTPLMLALDHIGTRHSSDSVRELVTRYNLRQEQAHVDARYENGRLALLFAIYWDDLATLSTLLDAGADVNLRDNEGRTALLDAIDGGHAAAAHRLLAHGADVNVRDQKGRTALSLAQRWPGRRIASLVLKAGDRKSRRA